MGNPLFRFHAQSQLPKLPVDLVIGHVRWSKSLGLPDGDIGKTFVIRCYHRDRVTTNAQTNPLSSFPIDWHPVNAWEGSHDDNWYRITFMTSARNPRGYEPNDPSPFRVHNFLDIEFRSGMIWKVPRLTRASARVLRPAQVVFNPPGQVQVLPDIQVIKVPWSFYRR